MPQTLPEDATVSITVEANGKETVLNASLAAQVWKEGKIITYRISGNPASDSLILDVTGDFTSPYTGTNLAFTVNSAYSADGSSTPIDWVAEYVDADGNVIDAPVWVEDFTLSGTGTTAGAITTVMNDIIFHAQSASTANLQKASDINASSGFTPYNLASATGGAAVENTANSYVISAPGKYSLPLVYGNAIKNGTTNSGAYTTTSHNRYALKGFLNHLGNAISSPYIYQNSGCTPKDAVLVWEDELNLIRHVSLSDDGTYITFDVPQNTIRQGNAMIAVRDADGTIMWSWQLWVTDIDPASCLRTLTVNGVSHAIWNENLGYVSPGDVVEFPEAAVNVRFTQTNVPDGMEPLSKTVTLTQGGITLTTPECNTFYQWGRKDPIMSSIKQWYDASHQEIKVLPQYTVTDVSTLIQWEICNPQTMAVGDHRLALPYSNLWNVNLGTDDNVKSVYDPSPAGYKVLPPNLDLLKYLMSNTSVTHTEAGYEVQPDDGGASLLFHSLGYRAGSNGALDGVGVQTEIWTPRVNGTRTEASVLVVKSTGVTMPTDPLLHALSLRPVKE